MRQPRSAPPNGAPSGSTAAAARRKPRASSVPAQDALGRYLSELREHPVLDREREHQLALHYQRTRDPEAAGALIRSNLRLVVKIAREYRSARGSLIDLLQEGNLGLVRSLGTYDPTRGIRLATYAAWWIRAYILKHILDNARLVRFGKTAAQRKLFFNLGRQRAALEARGIAVDAETLAAALGVPERDVRGMERGLGGAEVSLDAPVDREARAARSFLDRLEAPPNERPDKIFESNERQALLGKTLADFAATLSGRDRVIFEERLYAEEPETLQTLAERLGVSRERTRQLEQRLLAGMKAWVCGRIDAATLGANPLAA